MLAPHGYLPICRVLAQPSDHNGLTAAYRIKLRNGDELTVRLTDGT